jgi:integrase/recombinase XerD
MRAWTLVVLIMTDLAILESGRGNPRAEALCAEFLAGKKSAHTKDAYRRDIRRWLDFCAARDVDPLAAWPAHVQRWLAELAEGDPVVNRKPETGTTRARRLAAVSSWYGWLVRHQAAPRNPAELERAERPKRAPQRTPALSSGQAEKLLAAADADSPRAAAIVYLLTYTGIRVGELIAANGGDIGMTDGEMVLHVRGKGGSTRDVRLNTYVLARLGAYEATRRDRTQLPARQVHAGAGHDRPLIATYRGSRIDRKEVRRLLLRLAKEAGLPAQVAARMSPHVTRATYATSSFANRLDGRAVQVTMGHANFDTTAGYDRSKVTAERDPAIRLPGIIRPPETGSTRYDTDQS